MIDHRRASELAAAAIDFAPRPADVEALGDHLATCAACRRRSADLRLDAGRMAAAAVDAPARLRHRVRVAALEADAPHGGPSLVVVAALLMLVAGAVGAVVGVGGRGAGDNPLDAGIEGGVDWRTEVVALSATEFWIEVGGQRFTALGTPVVVGSDPGNARSWTLELAWREHGQAMRLNMDFASDGEVWWLEQLRTSNNLGPRDWITVSGGIVKARLGEAWTGDLDLEATAPGGRAMRLHIGSMTLRVAPRALDPGEAIPNEPAPPVPSERGRESDLPQPIPTRLPRASGP